MRYLLIGGSLVLAQVQDDSLAVVQTQRSLFLSLAGWAGSSVVVGAWQAFSSGPSDLRRNMGYQMLGWGAVNGVIAGVGAIGARRARTQAKDWTLERRRLRRILWINAGLDVGYMTLGAFLASRPDPRLRGNGYGIMLQGAGLLVIDAWHALRLKKVRTR